MALGEEGGAGGVLEDFSDAVVGFGGAFEVLVGADLSSDFFSLRVADICQLLGNVMRSTIGLEREKRFELGDTGGWRIWEWTLPVLE